MDDYGLLEAIRLSDLPSIKTIFQRKTKDRLQIQQLILSTLQRTTGGNRDVPLLLSATIDDTSIIAYFVSECEIDLNKPVEIDSSFREYTFPIISAIRSENLLALDWILKNGGSAEVVDGKGWTPLHHAVFGLNYSVVMRLLKNSVKNIDQENSDGQTTLHMATKSGHLEIVKLLINVGRATVGCSRSIDGMAPIHVAAKEGNHHLVLLFCESYNVSAKSQYKCKSSDGKFYTLKSPIHIAASEGNASTVEVLLKYCEANALDSVGNTPLHCCFLYKYDPLTMKPLEQYEETVKILLLHGCQVTAVNSKNQLASDLAEENGYEQLIGVMHLPKKKLSMRGSKKEKQVERPPSAVLVGAGSLGYQNAESAGNQIEEVENKPKVKKIKSKSGSKRLNVSHHNGDANESPKPKPLIRKSLSNEILSPENADSDNSEKVPEKVGKPKKVEQLTKQKDNNSDPELTMWLKEQAQLLKDKDNNDKTVPMAQSTPPPSKKIEKPTSPTKSPRPVMTNSMNIQKVKDRPLPPPKPFKKPVLPKLDTNKITEPDKDQSFDSMEPIRPVPRPRRNPKTSTDENKSPEKEAPEKIISKPKSKTLQKTPHVEDTDGDENRSNTIGKKAILPKAAITPTISEKSNGLQKEVKKSPPTKVPSRNTRKETKTSPIKNKEPVKKPLVPPSPESSEEDSDEDEDDEDDGNKYTDGNKFLNNKNAAHSFQQKMNDEVSYEDEEEEEEDDEESSDDDNNMQHHQAELLSVPYEIPTKTFSRTRSIEVNRNSDKKLGFSIVGGNHDGIFIHTVSKNSSSNIKPGDQIVEVNGRSISGKTKEDMYKLFETLVQNSERVALVLTDEGAELYREIVKNGGAGGDRFYVRAKFSYESGKKRELKIREGEIFCVTDSLPDKYDGLWKAQRMSTTIRKNDDIGVGFIPNRQKADQVALKQHLSTSSNSRNGAFLRSFRRAKSAEKLSNKGGRLNESADAFNSSLTIVGYERVLQAPAPLKKRPVIILGLFCDVVLGMLTQDSPALFFTPPPSVQLEIQNAEFDDAPVDYQMMQKLMSLSENNNNRHLLTIMSPAAIDFLEKKTTLDPIVIFISPVSKSIVKAVKAKLAPHYDRNPGHLYEEAAKFEKNYTHLFSSVVSYTADNWWFFHLKEAITHNQQQNIWVPEELALIAQKKKQQIQHQQRQPMNTLHSSHTNLNHKKMMSQTFDNLHNLPDMKNIELAKTKLKHHATSNGPASLPPKGKLLQQQHSNPAPVARKSETKVVNSSAVPVKNDQKVEMKQQTSRLNSNFDNKTKPSKQKSDSESDDDDDEEDSEDEEDDDEEEEESEEEEEEEKPKQKQQTVNTSKAKSIKEVPKLESCPQAFGRDKRAASEKTPESSSQRLVLDPPPSQNNKKPKNLFVRPNQTTSNLANNSTGSGFGDASYDSDASSLNAVVTTTSVAEVKNKKLMFQRATSNQASKETPL